MNQEAPYSYTKRLEYETKVDEQIQKMNSEYESRKEENAKYALKRTQELVSEYEESIRAEKALKEEAEGRGSFYVPKDPEFYVAVRIRGRNRVPPKEKKILELMRLKKPNHAVFIRNNAPMRSMLQRVRAYVAFGFGDIYLLRTLIYKRGMAKVRNMRVNLTNEAIEDHFGGEIRCVEELIYQIYKGTSLFKAANNFLWPFTLNPPKKGFGGRKVTDITQGGSTGCHYDKIGDLVYRMIE